MLKSVFFVFCLFWLSCFATVSPPPCVDLDVTNCAPYYCIIANITNVLTCVEDDCYTAYKTDLTSCGIDGKTCQRTTVQNIPAGGSKSACASESNRFSYCRLTTEALSDKHQEDDDNFPIMEKYCEDLGCGGLYAYFDKNDDVYFHCEEPNNDGTFGPDDFDPANCKKFDYKVKENIDGTTTCDWDDCSYYVEANCSSDCKVLDGLCVAKDVTFCGPGSWNLDVLTSDGCAQMGCGGLDVAKSKRGNSYLFCLPPPPPPKKNGASFLHVSSFILVITIFAFL